MHFGFSDEQEELRRTVRAFLEQRSPEPEVRRLMETDDGYDPAVWQQMGQQLGLQGLAIPEELGGAGYSYRELTIVLEEMGRALLPAPFFATSVLAAGALLHSGDDAAQKDLLPGIAAGDTIATLAYVGDGGRWSDLGAGVRAATGGGSHRLNGTTSFVLDGAVADVLLVVAVTDSGPSLFAVDGDADGVVRSPLFTMDQTRKLARVELSEAPGRLVGRDGGAGAILERTLQLAAVGLAHEQVGGAQRCLEMATQYAKDRVQFGRPIGSFQAVKHKCADMLVHVELARSAAYYAGWCAAELDDDLPIAAAMAKSYCSEAYYAVAAENIQVHGGIGFTWEHPAHLYFKRAKSSELLFGDPRHHRKLLAAEHRHLGGDVPIDPDKALGADLGSTPGSWREDDVILYHLGLGAGNPPTDPNELEYCYEAKLKVLPSFGVIPVFHGLGAINGSPGIEFDNAMLLHGEQDLVLHRPLPTKASVTNSGRIAGVYDKGKAALVVAEADTADERGDLLCTNRFSLFIRGEGGFGGDSGPKATNEAPDREPDLVLESPTLPQQALLYRLSGDKNPLHADPAYASLGGFDLPILHGLCSFGVVCKAVVDGALGGDVARVARYQVRFAGVVFPGETIVTSVWREGSDRLLLQASTKERQSAAITNGAMELR